MPESYCLFAGRISIPLPLAIMTGLALLLALRGLFHASVLFSCLLMVGFSCPLLQHLYSILCATFPCIMGVLNEVFRSSAHFQALFLSSPAYRLTGGHRPQTLVLSVGCVLIPKNILMTLFHFVASILEGNSVVSAHLMVRGKLPSLPGA